MTQAFEYIYLIFNKFLDFVFNQMMIVDGVSFGYVCIVILIMAIMIRNIIFLPRKGGTIRIGRKEKDDE